VQALRKRCAPPSPSLVSSDPSRFHSFSQTNLWRQRHGCRTATSTTSPRTSGMSDASWRYRSIFSEEVLMTVQVKWLLKKYSYFLPRSTTIYLLHTQHLLHVSAFSTGHYQAIHYVKRKCVYRHILILIMSFCGIYTCVLCNVLPDGL
jgi:hypothetical protein